MRLKLTTKKEEIEYIKRRIKANEDILKGLHKRRNEINKQIQDTEDIIDLYWIKLVNMEG